MHGDWNSQKVSLGLKVLPIVAKDAFATKTRSPDLLVLDQGHTQQLQPRPYMRSDHTFRNVSNFV